jgi:hypothetical protein
MMFFIGAIAIIRKGGLGPLLFCCTNLYILSFHKYFGKRISENGLTPFRFVVVIHHFNASCSFTFLPRATNDIGLINMDVLNQSKIFKKLLPFKK